MLLYRRGLDEFVQINNIYVDTTLIYFCQSYSIFLTKYWLCLAYMPEIIEVKYTKPQQSHPWKIDGALF